MLSRFTPPTLTQIKGAALHATRSPNRFLAGLWYKLFRMRAAPASTHSDSTLREKTPTDAHFREMSFTFCVIALAAKVACAEGQLTQNKYLAFRDAFPLSGGLCTRLRTLFTLACQNHTPFTHYATQLKYMFPRNKTLFSTLIDKLFSVACADGTLSAESERLLARIAHILEISAMDYMNLREKHVAPAPETVLGATRKGSQQLIKQHYRSLMRKYHPDRFASETVSPDVNKLLKLKTTEINEAYKKLQKKAA